MKYEEILKWRQEVNEARIQTVQILPTNLSTSVEPAMLPSPEQLVFKTGQSIDQLLASSPECKRDHDVKALRGALISVYSLVTECSQAIARQNGCCSLKAAQPEEAKCGTCYHPRYNSHLALHIRNTELGESINLFCAVISS